MYLAHVEPECPVVKSGAQCSTKGSRQLVVGFRFAFRIRWRRLSGRASPQPCVAENFLALFHVTVRLCGCGMATTCAGDSAVQNPALSAGIVCNSPVEIAANLPQVHTELCAQGCARCLSDRNKCICRTDHSDEVES